ncbi:uncharacterized protein METZ01_LOCUS131157, partial [marine metagenome]
VKPSFARPNYLSYLLQVYSVQPVTSPMPFFSRKVRGGARDRDQTGDLFLGKEPL